MPIDWKPFIDLVRRRQRFLLTTHVLPDPDGRIRKFELPGDEYRDIEAVVILDTGTWNQLGDFGAFLKTLTCDKFIIDHHLTQDELGATRLVDTTAEATGRLVYEAVQALGRP